MLERIREGSQGPWAMAIIALIVLSFVFAGVGSYLTSNGTTAVATVNGEEISAQELERAYQNQRAQMESQYGESIAQLFSSEQYLADFRRNVLDRLIAEKLIQQQATDMGLRVSDKQIRETITQMPEFQFGGQFDNERFQAILRQNGFQVADFRDYLRVQMTQNQLAAALTNSSFALDGEVQQANALQRQTRDAKYVLVSSDEFAGSIEVTDADVEAFYNNNLVCKALRLIKKNYKEIGLMCDVALDPYTSHGHDGILKNNYVDNDETVKILIKQSLLQAKMGCDVIAPSDMMDGRIGAIRKALDNNGFKQVQLLSYAVKYLSLIHI